MTLTEFLLARINEDEEAAAAAAGPPAYPQHDSAHDECVTLAESEGAATAGVDHIARHDPARVLAECAAKRVLVDAWDEQPEDGTSAAVTALADVYADHPNYDEAWRP